MLERGDIKEGKSLKMEDGVRLAETRRWCSFSRRCSLFIVLVLTLVLLFYNTNMEKMEWNHKWWIQDKSHGPKHTSVDMNDRSSSSTSAGVKTENSPKNFPSQEEANASTTTLGGNGLVPAATQLVTQNKSMALTPVPYISPGPYLVEYPYEYHFDINEPQKCEQQKPFLVLMVPVAPKNRHHRDIVRKTWGSENLILGKVVQLFFLLGQQSGEGSEGLQQQLLQESMEHHDLIQSNFVDCYKNLTIKTMVMLEWLDSYCYNALYAMKIDSDMFLNVPNLVNLLLNAPKTNYMTGLVVGGAAVLRNPKSKWYIPEEIYPYSQYPRYALGLGYIVSLDLPKKLLEASKHVKPLYIEDVYLGLCMQYLKISPTDPSDWGYFHVFPVIYSRCAYSRLIATTTYETSDRMWMWQDFKKTGSYC